MTFQTTFGRYLNRIYQEERELGAELLTTIDGLLMLFFGYYVLVPLGEICRRITVTGKTPIAVFVDGETKEFGKHCWRFLSMSLITNGG